MERAKRPFTPIAMVVLVGLVSCGSPPSSGSFHDPHEASNRAVFEENAAIDRALFGGSGRSEDAATPAAGGMTVAEVIGNVGGNLGLPSAAANSLLQGRLGAALENTLRFAINTTIGLGGVFDPASAAGVMGRDTDFGETLHVWGVGEGAYVVLPLLGPSTERDAFGLLVDMAVDPLDFVLTPRGRMADRAFTLGARLGDRVRYSDLVDMLNESADPYAQARLFYLQNRRFRLGVDVQEEYYDPYDDF